MRRLALVLALLVVVAQTVAAAEPAWMTKPLKADEAIVVYLYHSGWLVRTHSHVLIFDPVAAPGQKILEPLGVPPTALAGRNVTVLVSHAHSDHWDPSILGWVEQVPGIHYVFGWELEAKEPHVCLGRNRVVTRMGGVTIYNVHHAFDGIPESAFLVHADGLWLYHAGDHSHSRGAKDKTFRDNLSYLASRTHHLDLMFTPTWGGELYAIRVLRPRVVFPMHDGGREVQYARWASRSEVAAPPIVVGIADRPGRRFLYRNGRLRRAP
ncbi:MAG: MBL fold metallo-hydrolase [Acidobacteria bacterium]|nr:MBL fold metallo-hydrolase [Acidobacteriota bacterium]